MKKYVSIAVLLALSWAASAQYRDVKLPEKPESKPYKHYEMQETGVWFAADVDAGSSVMGSDNLQYAELTLTGGYRLSEFLRLGVGFGARVFLGDVSVKESGSRLGIPIYVNARGNVIPAYDRDLTPYWSLSVGAIAGDGLYLNPSLGISTGGVRNTFKVGLSYTLATFTDAQQATAAYSYFGLKAGYEF